MGNPLQTLASIYAGCGQKERRLLEVSACRLLMPMSHFSAWAGAPTSGTRVGLGSLLGHGLTAPLGVLDPLSERATCTREKLWLERPFWPAGIVSRRRVTSHGDSISALARSMPVEHKEIEFEKADEEVIVLQANGDVEERRKSHEPGEEKHERGQETEAVDDPDCEDVRKPNTARRPYTPTQTDIAKHVPLHLVDRSWCAQD